MIDFQLNCTEKMSGPWKT